MSRWLFFPSPVASAITMATTTGWDAYNRTITRSLGWSADATNGIGTWRWDIRSDSYGGFIYFNTTAQRDTWLAAYSGYNVRFTDSSANVYEFTGTMSAFLSVYIQLPLTGWSGTLPTVSTSNATTIELYT